MASNLSLPIRPKMNHPFSESASAALIRQESDRYYNRRKWKLEPIDSALSGIRVLLFACACRPVLHVGACGLPKGTN